MENYIQNLLDGYTELSEENKKDLEEIKVKKVDWETLKKERKFYTPEKQEFFGKHAELHDLIVKMVDITLRYESLGDVNEYNGLIEKGLNIQMKMSKDLADNPIE